MGVVKCSYFTYSPNVSTAGNFLTIACLRAIRITPSASVTVTTMGRPSGIAATAKLDTYIIHTMFVKKVI